MVPLFGQSDQNFDWNTVCLLDSYGDITQAFEKLTETSPRLSQSKPSSSNRPNKREQMKLRESPLPEELLNDLLTVSFIKIRRHELSLHM